MGWIRTFSLFLTKEINPFIAISGVIFNIFIGVTICRYPGVVSEASGVYLVSLAILDNFILVLGTLNFWTAGHDLGELADSLCRGLVFLPMLCLMLEPWLLVNITAERLAAVFMPLRQRVWFSRQRAALGLTLTLFSCVAFQFPSAGYFRLTEGRDGNSSCRLDAEFARRHLQWWSSADFLLSTVLPILLLLIACTAVVLKLRGHRVGVAADGPLEQKRRRKANAVTHSLVSAGLAYVILQTPLTVLVIYAAITDNITQLGEPSDSAIWLCKSLAETLVLVNSAINIFLYALRGSEFRKAAKGMLHNRAPTPSFGGKRSLSEKNTCKKSSMGGTPDGKRRHWSCPELVLGRTLLRSGRPEDRKAASMDLKAATRRLSMIETSRERVYRVDGAAFGDSVV